MTAVRLIASTFAAVVLATAATPAGWAQLAGTPAPIPTPPIPPPPRLGPQPKISLPSVSPPGRPVISIPEAAVLERLPIPPEAAITPADKSDPTPAPLPGALTPAPALVSPGGGLSQIREVAFIVDPGSSQVSPVAEAKLKEVANEMSRAPAARLEVRTFSPAKPHAESAAHRLSLARFLAIRDFLTRNGVADSKIDGRPLISSTTELNADRVELYIER